MSAAENLLLGGFNARTSWKAPCLAAALSPITLAGEQTLDGVSVQSGHRVLVAGQSAAAQNGIYVASTGAWARASDFGDARSAQLGSTTTVTGGTANSGVYRLTSPRVGDVRPGETAQTWTKIGEFDSAGDGLVAVPEATILMRPVGAGTGVPSAQTATTARTLLNVDDGATKGTVVARTVKAASTALTQGAAVVTDGSTVKLGTPAAVRAAGRVSGLAIAAASASATARIHTAGPIEPSIFNLGAGVACAVGLTAAGVPVRVTSTTHASGLDYVGHCDETGTITVSPRRARHYDVRDFGAKGDGVTDDLAAFNSAIYAMGPQPMPDFSVPAAYPGGTLFVPEGTYRLSAPLLISRAIHLLGEGGRGNIPRTILKFDAGTAPGINCQYVTASGTGGRGDYAILQDFVAVYANGTAGATFPHWNPSTAYVVGDIRVPRDQWGNVWGYAFRCTTAGTSGATEPAWISDYPPTGTTVADGTVTWTLFRGDGIRVNSNAVRIIDVETRNWPGNGIALLGNTFLTGEYASNVNVCRLVRCRSNSNGGHGLLVEGYDANAIEVTSFDPQQNRGWGIYDASGASNTYLACHLTDNEGGQVYSTNSTFLGCYSEGGAAPVVLKGGVWTGGTIGAIGNGSGGAVAAARGSFSGFYVPTWQASTAYVAGDRVKPTSGSNKFYYRCITSGTSGASEPTWIKALATLTPVDRYDTTDGTAIWRAEGYTETSNGIMDVTAGFCYPRTFRNARAERMVEFHAGFRNSGEYAFGWSLNDSQYSGSATATYRCEWLDADKHWAFTYDNSGSGRALRFTSTGAAEGPGQAVFQNGLFLGAKGLATTGNKRVFAASAVPTGAPQEGGTFKVGDRIFDSAPAVASGSIRIGWVCTVAGAPGTWEPLYGTNAPVGSGGSAASLVAGSAAATAVDFGGGIIGITSPSGIIVRATTAGNAAIQSLNAKAQIGGATGVDATITVVNNDFRVLNSAGEELHAWRNYAAVTPGSNAATTLGTLTVPANSAGVIKAEWLMRADGTNFRSVATKIAWVSGASIVTIGTLKEQTAESDLIGTVTPGFADCAATVTGASLVVTFALANASGIKSAIRTSRSTVQ